MNSSITTLLFSLLNSFLVFTLPGPKILSKKVGVSFAGDLSIIFSILTFTVLGNSSKLTVSPIT